MGAEGRSVITMPGYPGFSIQGAEMQLTLDTLKETGAFTGRPVEKEIKWKGRDGKEHIATVYVRPMGYHTTKAELLAYNGKSDPIAERIAAHICDQDGAPVFTAADILGTATPERGALDGPIVAWPSWLQFMM
ncbi:phage tail assembly chaperone family protein, TAC [Klebsiella pneumoniae subsp. pneumoniae]|nr:phage tail assembly chaperone family protein, TAC [Klebsiella pneumoniae subsp. pneumoniae]